MLRLKEEARAARDRAEPLSEQEMLACQRQILTILEDKRAKRFNPWLLLVPVAAAATLLVVLWPSQTWFDVVTGEECLAHSGDIVRAKCDAVIDVADDGVTLAASSELEREGSSSLRLRVGRARFRVAKRKTRSRPFELRVSHGTIRVLGTSFSVEQRPSSGSLEVHEGRVQFRWDDGTSPETLDKGARLSWPRKVVIAPQPEVVEEPEEPAKKRSRLTVTEIMRRLFQLRSQKRFDEAVRMLQAGSRRQAFTKTQRERLSFEAGNLIRQTRGEEAACAHWGKHSKRFPSSEHADAVAAALQKCPN